MVVAATGPKSLVLHNLREMLANSAWFRTWTGTGSVAAARLRVLLYSRDEGDLPDRPWVLLRFAGPVRAEQIAVATRGPLTGQVEFMVEADIDAGNQGDDEAAHLQADNEWGAFLRNLADTQVAVDSVLVEVGDLEEAPEVLDAEVCPVWPDEDDSERKSTGTEFPYWTAACRVQMGPTGMSGA